MIMRDHVARVSEQLEGDRGEVVVYDAAVEGEEAHEQEEVANLAELAHEGAGLAVGPAEDQGEDNQHGAVHDVAEHYSEQEGEAGNREYRWVDFLVLRDRICVNYLLERPC